MHKQVTTTWKQTLCVCLSLAAARQGRWTGNGISLAQYATVDTRNWAVDGTNGLVRLTAELGRANQEIALR